MTWTVRQWKQAGTALLLALAVGLAGCGGGGSGGGNGGSASFSGVNGPLDPVQDALGGLLDEQIGGVLPDPLGPLVDCTEDSLRFLVDVPDALLAAAAAIPAGADPQAIFQSAAANIGLSLNEFAARLQGALVALVGNGGCGTSLTGGLPGGSGGNPLAGTPLEALGAPLQALLGALSGLPTGPGAASDPNLVPLLGNTIAPLLAELSAAFAELPPEATAAPVFGGLLLTLEQATADLAVLLTEVGQYDSPGTSLALTNFLDHTLSNLLLEVIPVNQIDEASGQNVGDQIRDGIATAINALGTNGSSLQALFDPLFVDLLDGALSPLLDPVEGLLAQILGTAGGQAGSTAQPENGVLAAAAADGSTGTLDGLLLLLLTAADGSPLQDLIGVLGGNPAANPLLGLVEIIGGGLQIDNLLGTLITALQLPAQQHLLLNLISQLLGT